MQQPHATTQPLPARTTAPRALARWFTEEHAALRRMAGRQLHRRHLTHRLEADELISEIYLILAAKPGIAIYNSAHFRALAAQLTAWFLTDLQRRYSTLKHGGDHPHLPVSEWEPPAPQPCHMIEAVKDGLTKFERQQAEEHPVLVLRGQAGFTIDETADLLNIPVIRVKRLWQRGCRRLKAELQPRHGPSRRAERREHLCLG